MSARTTRWALLAALLGFGALGCDDSGSDEDGGPSMMTGDDGGSMMTGDDAGSSSGEDAGSMMSGDCPDGPLDAPRPGCRPTPVPDSGDPYLDCVDRINQFRWECQCLPPLERWREGEDCADQQAEYDGEGGGAHAGFRDNICSPRGNGQNECPGYSSLDQVMSLCLQQMWDEGPGEPFEEHGHYLNMTNPRFNKVACGFYTTADGAVWAVQNFSP